MLIHTRKILGSTLVAVALAATAHATDPAPLALAHTKVTFDDLNLNHGEDVRKLYARLERASRDVCQEVWGTEVSYGSRRRQCEREAMAKAVEDVKHPAMRLAAQSS